MCNDYGNRVPYSAYVEEFSQIRLPPILPKAALNLEPRDDIRPTELAPILRRHGEGVELAQPRWDLAPSRPKAPPVINFRSGGRRFPNGRRLVPASHFFEFGLPLCRAWIGAGASRRSHQLRCKPEQESCSRSRL